MQKISKNQVLKIIKNANDDSTYEIEMLDDNHAKLILFVTIKAKDNKSSMTTKQFQEFVIEFIQEQKLVNQRQEQTNMKQAEFNQFVIEFIQEQKLFNQRQEETNKKQEIFNQQQLEFNKMVIQRLDNIEKRLTNVENDIKLIKSCPTIKKELKN